MPKLLNFGQLLKKAFSAYRSVFMSILPLVIASVILDNLFSFIKHYKPTLQPYIKLHTLGIILSLPLSILQPKIIRE